MTKAAFERSRFDKDTKKAPEGSPKDKTKDKQQMAAFKKAAGKKPAKGKK